MSKYWPLIILILVSAAAGYVIALQSYGDLWHVWMHDFMGFFLCVFALLKLFNPSAFAKGFAKYDILAKRSVLYGRVYPWLELALGLGYLSFSMPELVYVSTVVLFGFGTIGVLAALKNGLNINCPCMGNILQVPLSTVTLTENIAMVAMAVVMLAEVL